MIGAEMFGLLTTLQSGRGTWLTSASTVGDTFKPASLALYGK
jgi:hypothetical protein